MFAKEQIDFFKINGFLKTNHSVYSEQQMKELKALTEIIINRNPAPGKSVHVYELLKKIPGFLDFVIEDQVLDLVESLIGPDIGLLSSSAFIKLPNSLSHFKWHADFNQIEYYEEISKINTAAMLIAVTPSTKETGCLQYIPGTHLKKTKYKYKTPPQDATGLPLKGDIYYGLDESEVDLSKGVVSLELPEGHCSFHDLHVIHSSQENKSQQDRILLNFWFFSTDVSALSKEAIECLQRQSRSRIHMRGKDLFKTCAYSIVGPNAH